MNARKTTSRCASGGFTLVELLVAMLIMTVGLLGLLQAVSVAYEHHARKRLREEALLVGEQQMNQLRTMALDPTATYRSTTSVVRNIAGVGKKFDVIRESQPIQPTGSTDRLKVTVGWSFRNVSSRHAVYTLKNR